MTSRPLRNAILALCGSAAASQAAALGFGRIPDSIAFGRPLHIVLPLRLDAGETLAPGCVQADVQIGEQRLPPAALRLTLQRDGGDGTHLHIRSALAVVEPMVAVQATVGCSGAVSRQFTLFADPPTPPLPAVPAAAAVIPGDEPRAVAVPAAAPPSAARPGPQGRSRRTAESGARNRRPAPVKEQARATPRREATTRSASAPRATAAAAPRLLLDKPEELLRTATLAVAAQDAALARAEEAASAAQASASAAEARLSAMDRSLQGMRDEAAASRQTMEQLRERLAQSEQSNRLLQPLALAAVLLGGLALGFGLRLRALRRDQSAQWRHAAAAPAPAAASEGALETAPAMLHPPPLPPRTAAATIEAQPERRAARERLAEAVLDAAMSADDLMDLEQQAEFFVVLGEEDAAIDLLMRHLRGSGGASPLPYLKLLEIYRRRGDREAYERTRQRFNRRFNAVASPWEAGVDAGRELQQYPEVMQRLQADWPQPIEAMAALENLMFRKHGGELFDLPAYRDVLALYAVARDLHRRAAPEDTEVDVLLPLQATGEARAGPPSIFDEVAAAGGGPVVEDRPTAPVDLDLSDDGSVRLGKPAAVLRRA